MPFYSWLYSPLIDQGFMNSDTTHSKFYEKSYKNYLKNNKETQSNMS